MLGEKETYLGEANIIKQVEMKEKRLRQEKEVSTRNQTTW